MSYKLVSALILFFSLVTMQAVSADDTLPFNERNGLKYVTAYINETPLELVFDTGANNIVLNNDALARLGIVEFNNAHKIQSHTAGGVVEGFIITLNSVRAGNVSKKDYPITYIPSSTENLLGATFFAGFNYYIDEDNKLIRLVPKGSYIFDRPEQPSAAPQPPAGPGHIEVEIDGVKYIYDGDKLVPQEQAPVKQPPAE